MSHTVELIPLSGIVLDGQAVCLGAARADVERALGKPLSVEKSAARPAGAGLTAAESAALAALGGPDGPAAVLGAAGVPDNPPHPPEWNAPHWFYFNNELRIDFDRQGRVEFIELLGGPEGELQPVMDGLELFQVPPEAVYDLLKAKNSGAVELGINCYCCVFLELETGIYRESVPEDVTELIGEAQTEGHPLSPEQIDYENGLTRWGAIGIGVKGYYTS